MCRRQKAWRRGKLRGGNKPQAGHILCALLQDIYTWNPCFFFVFVSPPSPLAQRTWHIRLERRKRQLEFTMAVPGVHTHMVHKYKISCQLVCRFLCEDTNLKPKTKPGRRAQTQTRAHKPPTASFWSGKIPPWRLFCRSDNNKGAFAAGFIIVFVAKMDGNHEGLARGRLLFRWACAALFSPAFPSLFDLWTLPLPWRMTNIFCRFVSCFKAVKDVH